jgi:hypothetical protein
MTLQQVFGCMRTGKPWASADESAKEAADGQNRAYGGLATR